MTTTVKDMMRDLVLEAEVVSMIQSYQVNLEQNDRLKEVVKQLLTIEYAKYTWADGGSNFLRYNRENSFGFSQVYKYTKDFDRVYAYKARRRVYAEKKAVLEAQKKEWCARIDVIRTYDEATKLALFKKMKCKELQNFYCINPSGTIRRWKKAVLVNACMNLVKP